MTTKGKLLIGVIGLLLLGIGLAIIITANSSSVQAVNYSLPSDLAPATNFQLHNLFVIPFPAILVVGGLFFLFLAITGNLTAKMILIESPHRTRLGIFGVLLLILGVAIFLVSSTSLLPITPPTPTPTVSISTTPYHAVISLNGPEKIRFGTSVKIELSINVISGTTSLPIIPLTASGGYTATVRIQAPNFDFSEDVTGFREEQSLSIQSPVKWAWSISPQEKRLGSQEVVFDILLQNHDGSRIDAPSSVKIYVTDPIGIPPGFVYLGTAIGGVRAFPYGHGYTVSGVSVRKKSGNNARKQPRNVGEEDASRVTNICCWLS